jgi:serine protease SohB
MRRFIPFVKKPPRVAVVRLSGMIAAGGRSAALNDENVAPLLEKAFRRGKPAAVALIINSPGGSPVQSSLIGARIRRLSEETETPVFAFVEDVAASGGYWIASAADEIFLDPCSVVGSIGVISASFGAHEFIARHGIERRVYTAGASKSMLDPFRPEQEADVARLRVLLDDLHGTFKSHVAERRGTRLPQDRDLFTGEVWIGASALEVGLADAIGHVVPVMKERFGKDVRFQRYGMKRGLFQRIGARVLTDALAEAEERALYARYGL